MNGYAHSIMDPLDDEIPYPEWMEEDLYGDTGYYAADEDLHDYAEESYNDMLASGGDL